MRHPLLYLLILAALDQDLFDLLAALDVKSVPTISRLLDSPCGNVVCSRYDPPVPRPLPDPTGGGMFRVQCTTCGFTYRQSVFASGSRNKRIINFGPVWDEALRRECEKGDATKEELKRRLGASTYIIKLRAIAIGVWHPQWPEQTTSSHKALIESQRSVRREHFREECRSKWLRLSKSHPGVGRRFLSVLDGRTYWFLYKYDNAWLDETTPVIRRPGPNRAPVLAETDATLAALINAAADVIANSATPTRITRQAIGRELGKTAALRFDRARMPLSMSVLTQRIEKLPAFSKRRACIEAGEGIMEEEKANRRRNDKQDA